jgi:7,8-dihydroneopterin aldolase/epimerase/oxygenase
MNDEAVRLEGMVPDSLRPRTGRILIESLEVMADIGFHEFERGSPQRLHITIELWVDGLERPPEQDEQAFAWDYDFVVAEVRRMAGERRYNLQETLVHALFDRLAAIGGIKALRVRSLKPDVYPDAAGVGVEIASFVGALP